MNVWCIIHLCSLPYVLSALQFFIKQLYDTLSFRMKSFIIIVALALLTGAVESKRRRRKCLAGWHQCAMAPCEIATCPKHADAVCSNDYCGGCNAIWKVNGLKVNDCFDVAEASVDFCSDNSYQCYVAPCQFSTCPNFPDATCRDNYCDGCTAQYFKDGQMVDCGN